VSKPRIRAEEISDVRLSCDVCEPGHAVADLRVVARRVSDDAELYLCLRCWKRLAKVAQEVVDAG